MTFTALVLGSILASSAAEKPFVCQPDPLVTMAPGETKNVQIKLKMTAEKKIYKDMVQVEVMDADQLVVGVVELPVGKSIQDPVGTAVREVYENGTVIQVPVTAPADAKGKSVLEVVVRFQGCSPSMCYPPDEQDMKVHVRVLP